MKMKKRIGDNLTNILLIITIIYCTACICDSLNDIKNAVDIITTKAQSNGWKLDSISDSTNNLHNIEEWTHKIYNSL